MSWLKEVIGTEKAIIAMCHMQAMPGDPAELIQNIRAIYEQLKAK